MTNSSKEHVLNTPPADAISSVAFSPSSSLLAIGSWDQYLHVYERSSGDSPFTLKQKIEFEAPILDVQINDSTAFCVGVDCTVRKIDLETGEQTVLSRHDEASNKVAYSTEHGLLLSTSWDGTLHVHQPESNDFIRVRLAAKPFAVSLTRERAVVAMAERKVSIYDLTALKRLVEQTGGTADHQSVLDMQPWQERESSLKFMTRAVACMPDGTGFATSSIEGRVGVEWFDPEAQQNTYAFKCHRQMQKTVDESGEEQDVDIVYPVNALAFHPVYGTFATGGGDGVVALWDAQTKRRVRQYHPLNSSVAAMSFSPDGKSLAIGISPGFEDGKESDDIDASQVKVVVRELADGEAKPKEKK
ncbi:mitotic spindle checkpoint protein Bub3 [Vermiconidia calcicola]|uniref:Mitotic spindle checkpoint protein Bub3 n=1 Tax=Vermiconidia calcicola TaxID=1690605 RepID=A0ACC3MLP5_9PEZI|nr:mitotic spindle checkpoint protein Bub3 [Vermiconidia calcicola]